MLRNILRLCLVASCCSMMEAFAPPTTVKSVVVVASQSQLPTRRSLSLSPHEESGETTTGVPSLFNNFRQHAATALATVGIAATLLLTTPTASWADGQTKDFKFPPIDFSDKNRCVLKSSSMGQANAARDSLFDLRQCQLQGVKAVGYDLSGAVMTATDASKANFREAYFSKGFLRDSNFDSADFSNAIVDRANFKGSSLRGTLFVNTVLTGTSFEGADVEGADFTEAAIGTFDLQNLCKNPTLKGENPVTGADTRFSAGCK